MIQLHNIYKVYTGNIVALQDLSLHIDKGEFVFITGASGAGKSTLLKLLYMAERATKGQIFIHGRCLEKLRDTSIPYLRRNIGVIFQDFKLLEKQTVFENIALPLEILGRRGRQLEMRVKEVLQRVHLLEKIHCRPEELSGGEKQRVAIARAIANDPMILLADEPTGNLDEKITLEIIDFFQYLNARGVTVLIASHNQSLIASMNKRTIQLAQGRLSSDSLNRF